MPTNGYHHDSSGTSSHLEFPHARLYSVLLSTLQDVMNIAKYTQICIVWNIRKAFIAYGGTPTYGFMYIAEYISWCVFSQFSFEGNTTQADWPIPEKVMRLGSKFLKYFRSLYSILLRIDFRLKFNLVTAEYIFPYNIPCKIEETCCFYPVTAFSFFFLSCRQAGCPSFKTDGEAKGHWRDTLYLMRQISNQFLVG